MVFKLIGSLGLFLLGMWLMTEGLKLAGGRALERLLGNWTSTRYRALGTGILITSLVQSSSAVTVATLGFVNAGIMGFQQAVWVVFGSNVGTTFTAWIVTFFGFSMKIDTITFPLIGIGAALRLFSPFERGRAFGMALAGFGLLFMGIGALSENFSGYSEQINIEEILANSGNPLAWSFVMGLLLTMLTQSSSAAIAIILTAVASGVAGLDLAAVAVIGANVGTTSTALIASIGATANAMRLAWAHVAFNLLTAAVALLLLPLFWTITTVIANAAKLDGNPIMMLAIFHSCFNVLGVMLIWPLEPRLSKWLLARFNKPTGKISPTSQLDPNIATIPDLAIRAVSSELEILLNSINQLSLPTENQAGTNPEQLTRLRQRINDSNTFISSTLKSELTGQQGDQLSLGLSVSYHLNNACKTITETIKKYQELSRASAVVPKPLNDWFEQLNDYNHKTNFNEDGLAREKLRQLLIEYQSIKARLFESAVNERLSIDSVDSALQAASLGRRFTEQLAQASEACQALLATGSKLKWQKPQNEINTDAPADKNH